LRDRKLLHNRVRDENSGTTVEERRFSAA